ncbi:MAG: hypothetical protein K8J31_24975 [Anaerolineae bacterium]|nr:hypothetical protein [Anaerolineae bacterium]
MSKQYVDEERIEALAQLRINRNNVALTSRQTGVPERTLREWRRLQRLEHGLPPNPPSAAAAAVIADHVARFSEPSEALQHVYDQFLQELVTIADTLPDILSTAPPYHQLLALMNMIDRIEKLQMLVPQTASQQTIRLEFVEPDGTVHHNPPWERNRTDDKLN